MAESAAPTVGPGTQAGSGGQSPAPAAADGATASAPDSKPATPPAEVRKHRLKIRGQEQELTEDKVLAYAQRALAGELGLDEVAKSRKEIETEKARIAAERERLKTDPWSVLQELGIDPDSVAAERILQRYDQDGKPRLTPEQEELQALKAQLEASKTKEAEAAKQAHEQAVAKAKVAKVREYSERFAAGLKEAGIQPGDPAAIGLTRRMAEYQAKDEAEGINHPPKVLAELAIEDARAEQVATWGRLQGDELLASMGDDLVTRVVAAKVAAIKRGRARQDPASGQPEPVAPTAPRQRGPDGKFTTAETRERREFLARLGR